MLPHLRAVIEQSLQSRSAAARADGDVSFGARMPLQHRGVCAQLGRYLVGNLVHDVTTALPLSNAPQERGQHHVGKCPQPEVAQ